MNKSTLVAAVVDDLDDPEGLGRVRVKFPHLDEETVQLGAPGISRERATIAATSSGPSAGDEVIVAFEHDDPRRPYVLGGVWSSPDPPPADKKAVDNDLRQIVTRSGHIVRFDDGKGAERIEIIASGGRPEDRARHRREADRGHGEAGRRRRRGVLRATSR